MKVEAELLVKAGYCDGWHGGMDKITGTEYWIVTGCAPTIQKPVQVYSDTLEGRRQADALEDWLLSNYNDLFSLHSVQQVEFSIRKHQWRLDRIKWCCEQMGDNE